MFVSANVKFHGFDVKSTSACKKLAMTLVEADAVFKRLLRFFELRPVNCHFRGGRLHAYTAKIR